MKDLGLASTRATKMNTFPLQHEKSNIKLLEEIDIKEDDSNEDTSQQLIAQNSI